MRVFAVKTPLIKPGDDLASLFLRSIQRLNLELEDGDVLAFSSKAVATANNNLVRLKDVSPSNAAKRLAEEHSLEPEFVELVFMEADKVYGGVARTVLTLKNGILTVNAGVDHKNAPGGYVALWPIEPHLEAEKLRRRIKMETGKNVGVLIVDSHVAPLRMGTRGIALGVAGFQPVRDCRGERDLYGRPLLITRHAIADDLASAAHLVMGELDERIPAVLIKDAPITLAEEVDRNSMKISPDECVYAKTLGLISEAIGVQSLDQRGADEGRNQSHRYPFKGVLKS